MVTIVTRAGKGSPLTNAELDANFTNLNGGKVELRGVLPGVEHDLNDYKASTSEGVWYQNSNSGAAAGLNYPTPRAGILEVYRWQTSGEPTIQRYTAYSTPAGGAVPMVYIRRSNGVDWTAWTQLYNIGVGGLLASEISDFSGAADARIQDVGWGRTASGKIWPLSGLGVDPTPVGSGAYIATTAMPGTPVANNGYVLTWEKFTATSGVMVAKDYSAGGRHYYRRFNGSSWGAWAELYTKGLGGLTIAEVSDFLPTMASIGLLTTGNAQLWPGNDLDASPAAVPSGDYTTTSATVGRPTSATLNVLMWRKTGNNQGILQAIPYTPSISRWYKKTWDGTAWSAWTSTDAGLIQSTEKGSANGVATLDANIRLPVAQLPSNAVVTTSGKIPVSVVPPVYGWGVTAAGPSWPLTDLTVDPANAPSGIYTIPSSMAGLPEEDGHIIQWMKFTTTSGLMVAYNYVNLGRVWIKRWNGSVWSPWERIGATDPWQLQPLGVAIPVFDHLTGVSPPPTNNSAYRYIKLTAGDAYNTDVLTSETVTGSFPLVVATAVISLSTSPINGETVQLINTSRAGIRGGSSGVLQQDAMQGHRHKFAYDDQRLTGSGSGGMVNGTIDTLSNDNVYDPITDGVNGEPRTAEETRGKNVGATYYMRIL